jgi:hypothetical protein
MLNIGTGSPLLFTKTFEIHRSDFKETAVGQGIYASKEIIGNLGYIPYAQFSQKPYTHGLENVPYRESSTVTLYFSRRLKGKLSEVYRRFNGSRRINYFNYLFKYFLGFNS